VSKALIAEALVLTFAFNPVVAVLRSSSTVLILVSKALLPFVLSLVNVCNASISPSATVTLPLVPKCPSKVVVLPSTVPTRVSKAEILLAFVAVAALAPTSLSQLEI
jgi:hypothetical protein